MKKPNYKSKKGAALVYVLIVLMVFGILGVAVLTIASFSTSQSLANYNMTQAGYSARSAVEATISYISNNMSTQNIIPTLGAPATISDLMTSSNINGAYKVKIERIDLYTAKVTATAKVGNMTSTVAANITLTLPGQKTANLENYVAYLKQSNDVKINDTIYVDSPLTDVNFNGDLKGDDLHYVASSNINIGNLTTADFDKITADKYVDWNNNGLTTIDLSSAGGVYKKEGDIVLDRDTTIKIGDADVFLFVKGNFSVTKYCSIVHDVGKTGTFFLILCGSNVSFYCDQGASGLNVDVPKENMANFFIYGPDIDIKRKNKFYFKGAVILNSYTGAPSQAAFRTAYLKPSAIINGVAKTNISPWEVLFDKFSQFNVNIVPLTGGSVNSIIWDKNVTEISLT